MAHPLPHRALAPPPGCEDAARTIPVEDAPAALLDGAAAAGVPILALRGARPSGPPGTWLRATYHRLDDPLDYALRTLPLRRRNAWIVFDRWIDVAEARRTAA